MCLLMLSSDQSQGNAFFSQGSGFSGQGRGLLCRALFGGALLLIILLGWLTTFKSREAGLVCGVTAGLVCAVKRARICSFGPVGRLWP